MLTWLRNSRINNFQDNLILHPCAEEKVSPSVFQGRDPKSYRDVYLRPHASVRLHAVWFSRFVQQKNGEAVVIQGASAPTPVNTNRSLCLFLHGNAGSVRQWGYVALEINRLGYDCLIPDPRQYGQSKGPLSEQALVDDVHKWYLFATEKLGYQSTHITVHGVSIGTALAIQLAAKVPVSTLVLEMPFDCIATLAKRHVGCWTPDFLLKYKFPSIECVGHLKCSKIFGVHALDDPLIPFTSFATLSSKIKGYAKQGKYEYSETIFRRGGHHVRGQSKEWTQFLLLAYT